MPEHGSGGHAVPPLPAAPQLAPQPLGPAAQLVERGKALVFDVLLWGQPARAFVLRFDGALVGYVNRCAHVPVEMDWQAGEFLDLERRYIVCAIHGAHYEPADGRCVGGPCGRGRLMPVAVAELDGQACWYPSADVRPAPPAEPAATESPP